MARICLFVILIVLLINVFAVPGNRIRRGFDNSEYIGRSGFGQGSDERDASVSQETGAGGGCSDDYGRGYGSSHEVAYNKDGRSSKENRPRRGGRSFSKASATASASAFNQNQASV